MKKYVVGFLFSNDSQQVVLIEKRNPEWQKGLFNGVGGKIELGETPIEAMVREFREEAGLYIEAQCWTHLVQIHRPNDYELSVFFAHSDLAFEAKTMEQETIALFRCNALPAKLLPNLRWLIPMALDKQLDLSTLLTLQEIAVERMAP